MAGPICERCKRKILPGQMVTMIGRSVDEMVDRIFYQGEILLVHADAQDCGVAEESEGGDK